MAASAKNQTIIKIIRYLLWAIIVIFPFGQLAVLPLGLLGLDNTIHVSLNDILVVLLWGTLLHNWLTGKLKLRDVPFIKPLSIFITVAIVSLVINIPKVTLTELGISSLYLLRWVGYTSIFFGVRTIIRTNPLSRIKLFWGLGITIFTAAVFGILQYFLYPDLRNLYYLGWDPHYLRVFGTFFDPGFLGLLFVLGLDLIYFKLLNKKTNWLLIPIIIIYLTLALTYSRSSYLSYGLSIGYIFLKTKKWILPIILLFIAAITYFLLPVSIASEGVRLGRTESSMARVSNWHLSVDLITKSPLFGIGFDTLRFTTDQTEQKYNNLPILSHSGAGLDNSFLFIAVTTGIVGLLCYIYLLFCFFKTGDDLIRVSLLAVTIHSFFNNSFFYPWVMIWLWMIVGLSSTKAEE